MMRCSSWTRKVAHDQGDPMIYKAHVSKGEVVFDDRVQFADGTQLLFKVVESSASSKKEAESLAEAIQDFVGCVEDWPVDASTTLEKSLYGRSPE